VDPALLQASLVRAAVVVLMVSLGLRIPVAAIVASLRHGRAFLLTGVLSFVAVPIGAWLLVRALGLPEPVAIGVLLVAAAPGGSLGLKLVDLARGDVALGLGLFFVIALIAPFSVPLTATALIGTGSSGLTIDTLPLVITLITIQLVPLAVALLVARVAPRPARRIGQLATTATTVLLGLLIAVALIANFDETLAIGPLGVLAYVILIVATLVAGLLLGRDRPTIARAIALLSAQRSTSLALLIATALDVPAVTGAVVAGGLLLLVVNPLVARALGARTPPLGRPEIALDTPGGY
jgi:BASS family bile acid:Na+ symporter